MLKRHLPFVLVLCGWVSVVYWNSLGGSFHFDDNPAIVQNPNIRSFDRVGFGMRFIPRLTLCLNYQISGTEPFSYHLVNLILHGVNAVLVYILTLAILRRLGKDKPYWAFFTALLWGLHPLNTEPVNWVIQRSMALMAMFYLTGLLFFDRAFGVEGETVSGRRKVLCFAACIACAVLSIFSKEVAATFPVALFLYYLLILRHQPTRQFWLVLSSSVALVILFAFLFGGVQRVGELYEQQGALDQKGGVEVFFDTLFIQMQAGLSYLGLALLPHPSLLNVDHEFIRAADFWSGLNIASYFILGGLLAGAFWVVKRAPLLSFAIFWMFLTHMTTSIIPRAETIVEYRNYLPLLGFAWGGLGGVSAVVSRLKMARWILPSALLVIASLFSWAVIERNKAWRTEETLWKDTIAKSPHKARPHQALAYFYLQNQRYAEAYAEARKATELDPGWLMGYVELGVAAREVGHTDEAIQAFEKIIHAAGNPSLPAGKVAEAYTNLGLICQEKSDYDRAEECYKKALEFQRENEATYQNMAVLYLLRFEKEKQPRYLEAAQDYVQRVLQLNPKSEKARKLLNILQMYHPPQKEKPQR